MDKQNDISFLEMLFMFLLSIILITSVVYILSVTKNSTHLIHPDLLEDNFILNTDDVFPKEICKNNIKYTVSRHTIQKTSLDNYMVMRYGTLFVKESYSYTLSEPQGSCSK